MNAPRWTHATMDESEARDRAGGRLRLELPRTARPVAMVFVAAIMVTSAFLMVLAPPTAFGSVGGLSSHPSVGSHSPALARPANGSGGGGGGGNGSGNGSGSGGGAPLTPILSGREPFFTNVPIPNATSAHAS